MRRFDEPRRGRAFSKPERATGFEYTDKRIAVVLLAGKPTNRLEVIATQFSGLVAEYRTSSSQTGTRTELAGMSRFRPEDAILDALLGSY